MRIKKLLFPIFIVSLFLVSCGETVHNHKDIYTCPMHPQIEMDHPGECPICGMQLVKKEDPLLESEHKNRSEQKEPDLKLSENKQSILNLDTILVSKGTINKTINLSGQVVYDPEIFSTANEYKSIGSENEWGKEIRAGIRLRFTKLGLSEKQIQYTLSKNSNLFLTGRSNQYALLVFQVYENDLSYLKVGKFIDLANPAETNALPKAKIVAMGNLINQDTRTLSVWCEVKDPLELFKPQMYVQGTYEIEKSNVLRIPRESIFPTGKSDLIYKKTDTNRYIPKKIKLGFSSTEWVEVIEGLEENDEIVSKASFLLDSESKLKLGGDQNDQHNH
ncbi:hypothetical protein EHQ94_12450 [Leptospira meyeri]|uniref:heavy metal-binding domain-containing protein n=1 Tax=Leptospira meyeri TaxID=29508 RepID=UPI000C2AC277|nr:heavy metal-binding domain-containing protein [Leptospira meyeri]PKA25263.1 hypothetical protein CH381_16525 [Leptospira sp. mixed culture ATI2-C-A1]TGM61016.1 hypothetical protein EHQ93_16525 [Leptospira meyeri]TGM66086.1 hypothetical protein EHQ94_12450 [Leptospira meyeri]